MARLIRSHDWVHTPLGPAAQWPTSLRTIVASCVAQGWAQLLWWGPGLVQLYNDAARDLLGHRHPGAFAAPAAQAWAKEWQTIEPWARQVLRTGQPVVDQELCLGAGQQGMAPPQWVRIGCHALRDDRGAIAGVALTVVKVHRVGTAPQEAGDAQPHPHGTRQRAGAAKLPADSHSLFHAMPVPLLALEPRQMRIVAANDAYLALTGRQREALLGQEVFEAFPEDPADPQRSGEQALRASLQQVLATGRSHVLPMQRYSARLGGDSDFVERWWSVVNTPVTGPDGQVTLVINCPENVTDLVRSQGLQSMGAFALQTQALIHRLHAAQDEARQAHAALRHSEQDLQRMADAVPEILWATDTTGNTLFVNEQWARYTGLPHDLPPPAKAASGFLHPQDAKRAFAGFDAARRADVPFECEARMRSALGDYRWFLIRAHPWRDPSSGDVTRWFGTAVDIHDRHTAGQALRESQAQQVFLLHLGDLLRNQSNPEAVMAYAAQALGQHLGVAAAGYGEVAPDEETVVIHHEYNDGRMPSAIGQHRFADYGLGIGETLRAGEEVFVEDFATDPRGPAGGTPAAQALAVRASAVVPLRKDGRLVATFYAMQPQPRRWSEAQRQLMREVAERTWGAVRRARAEIALRQSEARLRLALDAGGMGVFVWDLGVDHLAWDARQYELFGASRLEGEMTGERALSLVHPEDRTALQAAIRAVVDAGQGTFRFEFRIPQPEGWVRWVTGCAQVVPGFNGQAAQMIGLNFDTTQMHEAQAALAALNATLEQRVAQRTAELATARDAAEAANRAKSAFLAHMSHELRTPLNAIIGLSQLLHHRQLPPDVAGYVEHIHDAGEQLLALISDVLDLSRIGAGEMVLESATFEPRPLLEAVLALVQPQADVKGLALACEVAPELPRCLAGDALRLRQVLLNLLSNGVKFTDSGGVTLRVHVLTLEAAKVHLRLEVADSGIGIAPEQLQRIFEPFTQADDSTTRRFGGTGLGLSIVRRLVAMMGGEMTLRSAPGQGSTFSITVAFETVAAAGQAVGTPTT